MADIDWSQFTPVADNDSSADLQSLFANLADEFPDARVSSLTRSSAHNSEVGGVPNSQHIPRGSNAFGTAMDIVVPPSQRDNFLAQAPAYGLQAIDEGNHIHLQLPRGSSSANVDWSAFTPADDSQPSGDVDWSQFSPASPSFDNVASGSESAPQPLDGLVPDYMALADTVPDSPITAPSVLDMNANALEQTWLGMKQGALDAAAALSDSIGAGARAARGIYDAATSPVMGAAAPLLSSAVAAGDDTPEAISDAQTQNLGELRDLADLRARQQAREQSLRDGSFLDDVAYYGKQGLGNAAPLVAGIGASAIAPEAAPVILPALFGGQAAADTYGERRASGEAPADAAEAAATSGAINAGLAAIPGHVIATPFESPLLKAGALALSNEAITAAGAPINMAADQLAGRADYSPEDYLSATAEAAKTGVAPSLALGALGSRGNADPAARARRLVDELERTPVDPVDAGRAAAAAEFDATQAPAAQARESAPEQTTPAEQPASVRNSGTANALTPEQVSALASQRASEIAAKRKPTDVERFTLDFLRQNADDPAALAEGLGVRLAEPNTGTPEPNLGTENENATEAGRIIRGPQHHGENYGVADEVTGRTKWVPKSDFWPAYRANDPNPLNEKQAHAALEKFASGAALGVREQRFVDYANEVVRERKNDYEDDRMLHEEGSRQASNEDDIESMREIARSVGYSKRPRYSRQAEAPTAEGIEASDAAPDLTPEERMSFDRQREAMRLAEQRPAATNASGESSASLEAQGRLRDEAATGSLRMVIEPNGGVRPLIGVDAVDTTARPGQIIVQRGVGRNEWTLLSRGNDVPASLAGARVRSARPSLDAAVDAWGAENGKPVVRGPDDSANDVYYSKGERAAPSMTPEQSAEHNARTEEAASKTWGKGAISRLRNRAGLVFATKQEIAEKGIGGHTSADQLSDVNGFYDPKTGKTYVVSDNVSPHEAPGIVSHEVFHGNAEKFLGTDSFSRLKAAFRRLGGRDAEIAAAQKRVPKDTPVEHRDEEGLAYLAESAPNHPLTKRLTDEAKLFLNRLGVPLEWLNAHAAAVRKIAALNLRDAAERGSGGGGEGVRYHKAYHGSPHDFDQFSMDKIGTGEGAQAYGHGLYFAGNKEVANFYKRKLSGSNGENWQRAYDAAASSGIRPDDARAIAGHIQEWVDSGHKAKTFIRTHAIPEALMDAYSAAASAFGDVPNGRIYEVELAPKEHEYLDWDKKMPEQSPQVRAALDRLNDPMIEAWKKNGAYDHISGETMYRHIAGGVTRGSVAAGKSEAASNALHDAGIRGIRYLDGSSRGAGEGHHNYVIFADKDVSITAKYSRKNRGGDTTDRMATKKGVAGKQGQRAAGDESRREAKNADDFATGRAIAFDAIRNVAGVRRHSGSGLYGQDIEPRGKYMLFNESGKDPPGQARDGWSRYERSTVTFDNPLVLNAENWKQDLSGRYGGKAGRNLTKALRADGYDGIVTKDKYGVGEIVDLRDADSHAPDSSGALYSRKSANPDFDRENAPSDREVGSKQLTNVSEAKRAATAIRDVAHSAHDVRELGRGTIRAALAQRDRAVAKADASVSAFMHYFDKRPRSVLKDPRLALADVIRFEKGEQIQDATARPFFAAARKMLDEQAEKIRSYGKGYLDNLVEDYFPHQWKDPDRATAFYNGMSRKPLAGDKKFTKQRTFETTEDGLNAGMEPVSNNPVDLLMARYQSGEKLLASLQIMKELEDRGWVRNAKPGERTPTGWAHVNDNSFSGKLVPEPIARDLNNHLDPGLSKFAAWRNFRFAQNLLLSARLGLSAFHAGMTTIDTMATHADIGWRRALLLGDLKGGMMELARIPGAIFTSPVRGTKLLKQFYGVKPADTNTAAILDMLAEGGARGRMHPTDYNDSFTKFRRAWAQGDLKAETVHAVPAAIEATTRLIAHHLVPAQKMIARVMHAKFRLDELAGKLGTKRGDYAATIDAMHPDTLRQMAYEINATIDDRLGQFAYDNLFWNKTIKDALHASVQSVGWNYGSLRLLLGGASDLRKLAKPDSYIGPLDKAGKLTDEKMSRLTDRLSYLITLNAVVGLAGATLQYAMTGEEPKELKDWFFPRTGRKNPDDSDERIAFPSYVKDEFSFASHPLQTAQHKLHPFWSMLSEIANNKDFYGTQVFDPDADIPTEAKQFMTYLGKSFLPYAVQGAAKNATTGQSAAMTALPFVGITPAPGDITKTAFQQYVADRYFDKMPQGARSQEQAERSQKFREAVMAVRAGKQPDTEGFTNGQMKALSRSASQELPEYRFTRLGLNEQIKAYERATDEERERYHLRDIISRRARTGLRGLPEDERWALEKKLDEIFSNTKR